MKYRYKEQVYIDNGFHKGEATVIDLQEYRRFFFFKKRRYAVVLWDQDEFGEDVAIMTTVEENQIHPLKPDADVKKLKPV